MSHAACVIYSEAKGVVTPGWDQLSRVDVHVPLSPRIEYNNMTKCLKL
jgi:hypothetical protein